MRIRAYEPSDLEELVAFWHEATTMAYPYIAIMQQYTIDSHRAYFQRVILAEYSVWVGELDGQLVGFLAINQDFIDQLYVRVSQQQRGIGSALLEQAKRLSPTHLRLYAFQKNQPARAFYERHGFRAVKFGVSPPPENEPDVEYQWHRATDHQSQSPAPK